MRSAIVAAAFVAGAVAVPYNKRDVVTDVDVVTATVYATVWAGEESSTSSAAPVVTTTVTTQAAHYGHRHRPTTESTSVAAYTSVVSSQAPAPAPSSYEAPSSSVAPAPSSYEAPSSSVAPAPSSYQAPASSAAPAPSSYQAPASSAAPSSTASSGSSGSLVGATSVSDVPNPHSDDYTAITLYHHNMHRANHSASPLEWDDGLAATAQQIANTCNYAHSMDVNGGGYGQNIAAGTCPQNVSQVVSDLWYYPEVIQYNQTGTTYENWGHFSQMVWKNTTKVGCATTHCTGGLANTGSLIEPYFTVCNYGAPGNYAGEYNDNVMPSQGMAYMDWSAGMS